MTAVAALLAAFLIAPGVTLNVRGGEPATASTFSHWAHAMHNVALPTGPIRLVLSEQGCPNFPGYECSDPDRRPGHSTIFMLDDEPDAISRMQLFHEVGHVYDAQHHAEVVQSFRLIFGRWNDEQFAMAYSWCEANPRWESWRLYPGYDYAPTLRQHRMICRVLRG